MTESGNGLRLRDNVYLFWALLALPAVYLLVQRLVLHGKTDFVVLSGEIASWLLIATLLVTPVMMIFGPSRWLRVRRRHLGVATFSYTFLHLGLWLTEINLGALIRSFFRFEFLTGWIAAAIMLALALTSSDAMVRKLGPNWKRLQRWVYVAAALSLAHWLLITHTPLKALAWSAPVILLSAWRLLRQRRRTDPA